MPETYQYNHNQQQQNQQLQQQQQQGSSRLALRTSNTGGEIVQVQGGHIVRSTGRKDRHSKVCTAKGPRDRRVRLSAHTAIQFYDVQDRLGYDRPSKAVDWLIKKAKTAIDELAQLPAWKPSNNSSRNDISTSNLNFEQDPDQGIGIQEYPGDENGNESFLPPSLDQDSIADTIKSFFPMGASSNGPNNTSSADMHQFNQSQDLRLSLQSFQDPIMQHNHHGHSHNSGNGNGNSSGTNNMFFDGSGWCEDNNPTHHAHHAHHAHQTGSGGFQRMVTWGNGGGGGGDGISAGFGSATPVVAQAPQMSFLQPLFGQATNNQLFTQRGPLQSSNAPSFRAWIDPPPVFTGVAIDQQPTLAFHHPSSMSGFASGLGGFSGFRIPTRIQGEDEEHDGVSDKPSSASSDSRH